MTNNEKFNKIFRENKTVEENADIIIHEKRISGEITAKTDVSGMRKAIVEWLNSEATE